MNNVEKLYKEKEIFEALDSYRQPLYYEHKEGKVIIGLTGNFKE